MSGFIEWLESMNEKDTKVRAVLRRSLAFDPGTFVPAFPYVEPFLKDQESSWRRKAYYLTAALWASHWREGRTGEKWSIGKACAEYHKSLRGSASTERRFINFLDADPDQLPHRLRQLVALLKDYPLDFDDLLTGLLSWTKDGKTTQNKWARDFYRTLSPETEAETPTKEEGP